MRARRLAGALGAAILLLLASQSISAGQPEFFLVQRVVDGDTVIVRGLGSVRLIGVDTPETVHPTKPVEAFGLEAKRFLERLVKGKQLRLEYDRERTDRYRRTLAYLFLEDGTFVNAEIVKQGYGFAYTKYPFKYLQEFRRYEREAREASRGLWAEADETRQ